MLVGDVGGPSAASGTVFAYVQQSDGTWPLAYQLSPNPSNGVTHGFGINVKSQASTPSSPHRKTARFTPSIFRRMRMCLCNTLTRVASLA